MQPKFRPFIVGFCDSAVVIPYFFGLNPLFSQVPCLLLKIFLLFAAPERGRSLLASRLPFVGALILPPLISLLFARGDIIPSLLQGIGFALYLMTSLLLLRAEVMRSYLRGLAWTITVSSAVLVVMALTHRLIVVYGRPYYFHGLQPNLGAEIAVVGAIAAALGARRPYPFIVINLAASWLLQGRSAIIAIVTALLIMVGLAVWDSIKRKGLVHLIAIPSLIAAIAASLPTILDAMKIHDRYRGEATGIAGRTKRWSNAWDTFMDHPLTGIGYEMHRTLGLEVPHSFALFALSELGLLSVFTFVSLIGLWWLSLRNNTRASLFIIPFIPLFVFNDRFMNMNTYPLCMFVLMVATSVKSYRRRAHSDDRLQPSQTQTKRPRKFPTTNQLSGRSVLAFANSKLSSEA